MGQQHRKQTKRRRRTAYIKRQKEIRKNSRPTASVPLAKKIVQPQPAAEPAAEVVVPVAAEQTAAAEAAAPAKKAPAKKAAAKSTTAKKAPAKKATAKKAAEAPAEAPAAEEQA